MRAGFIAILITFFPALATAQLKQGDFELTLSGTGITGSPGGGLDFGVSASLGYFLTDNLELGVRQKAAYTDINIAGAFFGQTQLAADFNFALGSRWQPFIGAQFGYQYGDLVSDSLEAGPEAGIRFFVNQSTFIFFTAEYDFFFNSHSSDDDQFVFALGIGFRF